MSELPSTHPGTQPGPHAGPIPRGQKRRREIAAVAERVFFENGFSDTTMQTIALRAGASKETLYRHFGSKEGLFAEIVETRAESFLDDLDEKFGRPGSVEAVLRDLALRLLESIIRPDAINLCRTVIAEAPRTPELGEIFFARGPERVSGRLSEYLAAARERGEVSCTDPDVSARIFLGRHGAVSPEAALSPIPDPVDEGPDQGAYRRSRRHVPPEIRALRQA
jgi:Transcriptional regulator